MRRPMGKQEGIDSLPIRALKSLRGAFEEFVWAAIGARSFMVR